MRRAAVPGDYDLEKAELSRILASRPFLRAPTLSKMLAYICEKLGAFAEAREHWRAYANLDPSSPWSFYARQRLASSSAPRSV